MGKRILVALLGTAIFVAVIAPSLVSAAGVERVARLVGSEEVPGPGDEDGTGRARFRINDETNRVCFDVGWRNIEAPTAAHIHEGAKGQSGDPVVTLWVTTELPQSLTGVRGCVDAPPGVVKALIDRPQDYYVNVHNNEFSAGAIRGQLRIPR